MFIYRKQSAGCCFQFQNVNNSKDLFYLLLEVPNIYSHFNTVYQDTNFKIEVVLIG
jgi:hypothetical protein